MIAFVKMTPLNEKIRKWKLGKILQPSLSTRMFGFRLSLYDDFMADTIRRLFRDVT